MAEKSEAHVTAKTILVGDGDAALLLIEFILDCPACGHQQIQIAGHHLRLIRDVLIAAIDAYPALTGKESGYRVLDRLKFGGPANDPTTS